MSTPMSRRSMLQAAGAAFAAGAIGPRVSLGDPGPQRAGPLRIAHLTDLHIQPERRAFEGVAACLAHVQKGESKPELIVTGGDLIMDAFDSDEVRTRLQWELLTRAFKDHCGVPVAHCLGNHDIWGWNKKKSKTTGAERAWGKVWAREQLALERTYHALDRGRWRIIILDSVQPDPLDGSGYIGRIDDEQFAWLERDLAAMAPDRHALIVSHISILTATTLLGKPNEKNEYAVSGGLMHVDSKRLRTLFVSSGRVRACVSGHMHLVDRVEVDGVTYLCDGAVSGAWWKGMHQTCREGYALLDLHDDGRVERTYVPFDWVAVE